ncbi:MAG: hypothetical protein U1A27_10995 [Phycisphaerae bacterium]
MQFDHDWWHGGGLERHIAEAKRRATRNKFPKAGLDKGEPRGEAAKFFDGLEARIILYLRDNAVYEIKELASVERTSYLTFECLSAEEAYRVGAFVVAVPYDEIARVEIFAVHKSEKPEESPLIKGFGAAGPRTVDRKQPPPAEPA